MRELEFLPAWYPLLRGRHRLLVLQAAGTAAVLVTILAVVGVKQLQVRAARNTSAVLASQLRLTRQDVTRLDQKLGYQQQLRRQDRILAELGIGVDSTRLLGALQTAMTPEMALTNVSLESAEQVRPAVLTNTRRAGAPAGYVERAAEVDRRLKVIVDGVAPSDLQAATLLARLNNVPVFENVAFAFLRDGRTRDGHLSRDFEVTFDLNLNAPTEGR